MQLDNVRHEFKKLFFGEQLLNVIKCRYRIMKENKQ